MPNKSVQITRLNRGDLFTWEDRPYVWEFQEIVTDDENKITHCLAWCVASKIDDVWSTIREPRLENWNYCANVRKVQMTFAEI